ncbi:hypothetical protein P23_0673 [Acinetobacter calcoaceticus]|nr:hypothetical protein P23_0673 [Acinetobacter calcoaceticus]
MHCEGFSSSIKKYAHTINSNVNLIVCLKVL